jgi:hypothetical protein
VSVCVFHSDDCGYICAWKADSELKIKVLSRRRCVVVSGFAFGTDDSRFESLLGYKVLGSYTSKCYYVIYVICSEFEVNTRTRITTIIFKS